MNILGKRPGRKRSFSLEDVLAVVIDQGVASFSLREVAKRLGVQPAALYRVCESRDQLQLLALAQIARELEQTIKPCETWDSQLRAWVEANWQLFLKYPELVQVVNGRPEAFTTALPCFIELIDRLVKLGIPGGKPVATFALDFLGDTVMMTFIQMIPYLFPDAQGQSGKEKVLAALGDMPDIFDIEHMGSRGWLDAKTEFIIAGIKADLSPLLGY